MPGLLLIGFPNVPRGEFILFFQLHPTNRRCDSIGYVEFRAMDLVPRAIALSGTIVMGLPIMVQLTESERNKLHPGDGLVHL